MASARADTHHYSLAPIFVASVLRKLSDDVIICGTNAGSTACITEPFNFIEDSQNSSCCTDPRCTALSKEALVKRLRPMQMYNPGALTRPRATPCTIGLPPAQILANARVSYAPEMFCT